MGEENTGEGMRGGVRKPGPTWRVLVSEGWVLFPPKLNLAEFLGATQLAVGSQDHPGHREESTIHKRGGRNSHKA